MVAVVCNNNELGRIGSMKQHTAAKTTIIIMVLGVVLLLGIYAFRFLNPLASIALSAIVLVAAFYFSLKIWRMKG